MTTSDEEGDNDAGGPLIKDQKIRARTYRVAAALFLLWVGYFIATLVMKVEPGVHGDMFGSLNTLFSGAAFVGVILTILLQSRELELQREELRRSVQAQKALVEEAVRDRNAAQAVRLLGCYADWISAMAAIRNKLGPTPPVADERASDPDYLKELVEALAKLAESEQLLRLLDTEISVSMVSTEAVEAATGALPSGETPTGYWSPYELMRDAALHLQGTTIVEEGAAVRAWVIPLPSQKVAAFAHEQANEVLERVRKRLHPIVAISKLS